MPQIRIRASARRDLVAHFVYLHENAGEEVAERFLARAEESFEVLLRHPELGVALTLRGVELAGMRKWRVEDSTSS
jgi:toxin ParE1/3/4